jgi:hypothetical protein
VCEESDEHDKCDLGIHHCALALPEDGLAIASRVQSDWLRITLDAADAGVAAVATFFGIGAIALPLVGACRVSPRNRGDVFTYRAHCGGDSEERIHLFTEKELKERFGLVDIAFKMRELTLDSEALNLHIRQCSQHSLRREVRDIRRWRDSIKGALKLLKKRAALSYLGLAADATEVDISRVYRKLALEMHPDKGGDPDQFCTLQEMRQRTLDAYDCEDVPNKEKASNDDLDADMEGKPDLGLLRWEAHRSIVQFWEEVKATQKEISADSTLGDSRGEVMRVLRLFVTTSVNQERVDRAREGSACAVEATIDHIVKAGAEIIGVASVLDPQATQSILATHLGGFLATGSQSMNLHALLLQAVSEVKPQVESMLTRIDSELVIGQGRHGSHPLFAATAPCDEKSAECVLHRESQKVGGSASPGVEGDADHRTNSHDDEALWDLLEQDMESKRTTLPQNVAAAAAAADIQADTRVADDEETLKESLLTALSAEVAEPVLSNPLSQDQEMCMTSMDSLAPQFPDHPSQLSELFSATSIEPFKIFEDENVLTFAPPPMNLGSYKMQLRMISRGTWEELQVELLDGSSTIVGQLKGIYIVRGPGAFLDACCSGAIEEDSLARNFVDADGCPTSCWKHRVSARASGGGLLFLEQLIIEQTTVHDVASDFVRAVLQILGGPMKRVTLALWTDGMGSTVGRGETAPLRDLCAGIGFQSVPGDSEILYMEVEARSMRSGKTKVVRKAAAKRKREEDANKENDAISVQRPLKQGKMDSMQQFPRQPAYSITFDGSVTAVGDLNIPPATWDKLTPRIRQNLSTAAATGIMALKADAARFTSGKQGGCYWGCKSFPPQLRQGVFKAYVKYLLKL